MLKTKKALVIGGPTGVGESTITKHIVRAYPKIFVRLITATTRKLRSNEKEGIDYYFFSEEQFKDEIKKGNILEWQNTRQGIYYGTYKPELEKQLKKGLAVIINPDIVGAKFFKKKYNATTIFIMPESIESLKQRQLDRNPRILPSKLKERLDYAQYELKNESAFYDYHIFNFYGKMDKTIQKILDVLKKEGYIE
jgi:guanylate kinase